MIITFRILAKSEQFIQGYLGIFRDIYAYSATLTGAQIVGEREDFLARFENRKNVLILERKALILSIFELNYPFNM